MLPIITVPNQVAQYLANYRDVFCREAGFDSISRYISGLLISPNKTMQGIHDLQVWEDHEEARSCRAMHASVFEAGWKSDRLMSVHRQNVSKSYRSGRVVIAFDWTLSHHDKGPCIYGVKKRYDYTRNCSTWHQILLTATVSDSKRVDGLDVVVQRPTFEKEEKAYLKATSKDTYSSKPELHQRLIELLHHLQHQKAYKTRSELFAEMVALIEDEGHFPTADYAFDNGVLAPLVVKKIESYGKYWLSELETSRLIFWDNTYRRIDEVASHLRDTHPESFRPITAQLRNGETKSYWVFSKCVRLKKYGKKRIFLVHETEDLSDTPRFLITNALHWEATRALITWSYRWSSEIFHEFGKQDAGLESAQVRNEEAVIKHFCLSCVAQSALQCIAAKPSTSEKFKFAQGEITSGQRWRTLTREVIRSIVAFVKVLIGQGWVCEEIVDRLIPI